MVLIDIFLISIIYGKVDGHRREQRTIDTNIHPIMVPAQIIKLSRINLCHMCNIDRNLPSMISGNSMRVYH